MARVDLSGAEIVDSHCHPYRVADLVRRDPLGFETRCMFMGAGFASSSRLDPGVWSRVEELTESTVFGLALRKWLAGFLECEPTRDAVAAARAKAFLADPTGYTKRLLAEENVVGVLSDEGYPQPTIPREDFEVDLGVPVHRVARLETWILEHRGGEFDDLVTGVESAVATAAADPRCVAYKSIIAYRTGLDVGDPSPDEAEAALRRWRDDRWRESREHAKPVRDFLLRRALAVARDHYRPFHLHCGGGDPDIDPTHARPEQLFSLLRDHQDQPIVLVHSGYPWVREAAYVASVLPNVYLELSELIPWGFSQVEWALEMLVGTAPAAKLLFGSDQASEPEMFFAAARLARGALTRVLARFVDLDYLTASEAEALGRGVLADNTRLLHGIAG